MNAHHKIPDTVLDRRNIFKRHWLTVRLGSIVVFGLLLTAAISLWTSIPIVKSLAQLSTDSHQLESFGDTRLQLVELFKLRRTLIETQLQNCGEFSECSIKVAGKIATAKKIGADKTAKSNEIKWDSETDFRAYDGKNWWSFHIDLKPVQPLAEDLASWLSAHEHLGLISDDLTQSFIVTMVVAAAAGVVICLLLVFFLSQNLRGQYASLAEYIRTLAGGVTKPIPPLLQHKGELSGLAREVHGLSQELAEAQKRVVDAERMSVWQTVARKVAHEIKNPLTPIGLVGEQLLMISRQTPDPKLKHMLGESSRIIGEETASLNRMVREFTAFGRLPTPKLQVTNLTQLLQDFVERNQNSYDNTVSIKFESADDLQTCHAHVDSSMIHQILHNLLNNARLAKTPAAVQLKVTLSKSDPFWAVDVTDDGPGIPVELQERIFDAYVTTRSTGDKEKGMGLGLTISRQIAVDHGGTLTLLSTSASGTTIRLCLPVIVTTSENEVAG